MPPSHLAVLCGRALLALAVTTAAASAGDPCDGPFTPQLFGPDSFHVDDLPVVGDSVLLTFDTAGLAPMVGVDGSAFVGQPGASLIPHVTTVLPGQMIVHLPVGLLDEPLLDVAAVNHLTHVDEYCFSDTLTVTLLPGSANGVVSVTGEPRRWHTLTFDVRGPATHEQDTPNPFLDRRLEFTFVHTDGTSLTVPGFYAADGDAAETSASGGDVWRARFTPPLEGGWSWTVRFRNGPGVAVDPDPLAGTADPLLDGLVGSVQVGPTDKLPPDLRAEGRLVHEGEPWLRRAGSGGLFLKGGSNSPENLLAYADFDGTTASHHYLPHLGDAQPGDPTWQGGRGASLLGVVNYLTSVGVNALYFLTFNVGGDGDDVWPWTAPTETLRFDVSKLAQWERVFAHMDRRGMLKHVVLQEEEIDHVLGAPESTARALYHRELVARFGHHLGLVWNLGEELSVSLSEIAGLAEALEALDPYGHPVLVHTFPDEQDQVYPPLLDNPEVDGASLQSALPELVHDETRTWVAESALVGGDDGWLVFADEVGPYNIGVPPDGLGADPQHDGHRADVLWGHFMGGGGGVEWYFGYAYPDGDLDCEDWRTRELLWDQTRHALTFFGSLVPFADLAPADAALVGHGDYALADGEDCYVFYDRDVSSTMRVKLGKGVYSVAWFNPRTGLGLQLGTKPVVSGPGVQKLGWPPFGGDGAVVLKLIGDGEPDLEAEGESETDPGEPPPFGDPP